MTLLQKVKAWENAAHEESRRLMREGQHSLADVERGKVYAYQNVADELKAAANKARAKASAQA